MDKNASITRPMAMTLACVPLRIIGPAPPSFDIIIPPPPPPAAVERLWVASFQPRPELPPATPLDMGRRNGSL